MKKKKNRRIPKIKQHIPRNLERRYVVAVNKLMTPVYKLVKERVLAKLKMFKTAYDRDMKTDAYGELITETFEGIDFAIMMDVTPDKIEGIAAEQANLVNINQKNQFQKQIFSVLGVNPFLTESWLRPRIEAFRKENVSLVTNMSDEYLNKIEGIVRNGVNSGALVKTMAEEIRKATDITRNRSKLIAVDQTQKFFGDLNRLRQVELGVEEYVWSTSLDERVRGNPSGKFPNASPSHFSREGKVFSWKKPPSDGHPGFAVRCRCIATPVIPEDL